MDPEHTILCEHLADGKYFVGAEDLPGFTVVRRSRGVDDALIGRVHGATGNGQVMDIDSFPGACVVSAVDAGLVALTRYARSPRPEPQRHVYFLQSETFLARRADLALTGADFRPWLQALPPPPADLYTRQERDLPPLALTIRNPPQRAQAVVARTVEQLGADFVLALFEAVLRGLPLAIVAFPAEEDARLDLLETLVLCLPRALRSDLSLSTLTYEPEICPARVKFLGSRRGAPGHILASWEARHVALPADEAGAARRYTTWLARYLEENGPAALVAMVEGLDLPEGLGPQEAPEALVRLMQGSLGVRCVLRDLARGEARYDEVLACLRDAGPGLRDGGPLLRFALREMLAGRGDPADAEFILRCDPQADLLAGLIPNGLQTEVDHEALQRVLARWAGLPDLPMAWRHEVYAICARELMRLRESGQRTRIAPALKGFVEAGVARLLPDGYPRLLEGAAKALLEGPPPGRPAMAELVLAILAAARERAALDVILGRGPLRDLLAQSAPAILELLGDLAGGRPARASAERCLAASDQPDLAAAIGTLGLDLGAAPDLYPPLLAAIARPRQVPASAMHERWLERFVAQGPLAALPPESRQQVLELTLAQSPALTAAMLQVVDGQAGRQAVDGMLAPLVQRLGGSQGGEAYLGLLAAAHEQGLSAGLRVHIGAAILRRCGWPDGLAPLADQVAGLAASGAARDLAPDELAELLAYGYRAGHMRQEVWSRVADVTFADIFRLRRPALIADRLQRLRDRLLGAGARLRPDQVAQRQQAYRDALLRAARTQWPVESAGEVDELTNALAHREMYDEALLVDLAALDLAGATPVRRQIAAELWVERALDLEYLVRLFSLLPRESAHALRAGSGTLRVSQARARQAVAWWESVEKDLPRGFLKASPGWLANLEAFVAALQEWLRQEPKRT